MNDRPPPSFLSPWDILPLIGGIALAVIAAYLWPQLPSLIPTHFGPAGRPDGWTPKAVAPWFMFGFPLATWILLAAAGKQSFSKLPEQRAIQARAMPPFRGFLGLGLFLLMSLMVLIPVYGLGIFFPILAVFFGLLVAGIVLMVRRTKGLIPPEIRQAYHWGLFYYHPGDPRVWVEKLIGIGWTLNFARPLAWVWLLLLLLPLAVILAVPGVK